MRRVLTAFPGILASAISVVIVAAYPSPQSPAPATLKSLIEEYRHGDAALALAEFISWDPKRMASEYAVWDAERVAASRVLPAGADTGDIAALVNLNTAAAVELGELGAKRLSAASARVPRYQDALRLVKMLAPRASDAEVRAFCRNWFVLATSLWLSARQCSQAAKTAHDGLEALGPDAQLSLAAGSVAEAAMGPFENGAEVELACGEQWGASQFAWHGASMVQLGYRQNAQAWLERAVALDPALAEAHLRLGRVLYWTDRPTEAQRELERSIAGVSSTERHFVGYLAAIFLGQLHEEARRVQEARRAYEQAIRFNPRGHIARLALGYLLLMSGPPEEGWARVRAAFGETADGSGDEPDPWLMYRSGQVWQASERVHALEAWVRR